LSIGLISFLNRREEFIAQLAGGIDHHWYGIANLCCHPMNVADKAAVVHVRAVSSDTDHVSRGGNALAG
jgi:hypothetical protein